MTTEASPTSRRAILGVALGSVAAGVVTTLSRPAAALAADGETMLVGHSYTETTATRLTQSNPNQVAFEAIHEATDSGIAISASSVAGPAILAGSLNGNGISASGGQSAITADGTETGVSASGATGVAASSTSPTGRGVFGFSSGVGVYGASDTSAGVIGYSGVGGGAEPVTRTNTGVYGYADRDATSVGVRGFATSGTGGSFATTSGFALKTSGRLSLAKASGSVTIAAGTKSKSITPGTDIAATTLAFATLQGSAGGTTTVHRVALNTSTNTITVYLTANATQAVKVAWLVLN